MKTIKAARLLSYGGPESVRIESTSLPEPQAGQLSIRMLAAGVNPIDWKIRAGYLQKVMPVELPFTLGGDFSGVVEGAGAGVTGFRSGDEVYGYAPVVKGGSGAFAEALVAPVNTVGPKPRNVGYVEAGALPLAGVSAWQALTEHLQVNAGQKVLIHGGAGGIGSIAIQIAKYLGAQVATTVSAGKIDYVKSLGAGDVIDYKTRKFEDAVSRVDAVLDTAGGETYARSYRVLKRGGRLVSLLEQPRQELMSQFGVEASILFTQVTTERLKRLSELVEKGAVKVHVAKTFPLDLTAEALETLEKEPAKGKIALTMA